MHVSSILTLSFLFLSFFAYSQSNVEYTYVATTDDGVEFYLYVENSDRFDVGLWLKEIKPFKTIKNKQGKNIQSGGGYTLSFITIICDERTFSISKVVKYNIQNKIISNKESMGVLHKIIPGSVMGVVRASVCPD